MGYGYAISTASRIPCILLGDPPSISLARNGEDGLGLAYHDLGLNWEVCVVIEPILLGIVLGMVVVTLAGLFVAAYRQYQRSNKIGL